jgi:hypothetical protein
MTEKEMEELGHLIRLAVARQRANVERDFTLAKCSGKQGFDSFDIARTKIRMEVRGFVQPYRCEYCGKWHLGGARSGKERRAILDRSHFRHRNHRRSW